MLSADTAWSNEGSASIENAKPSPKRNVAELEVDIEAPEGGAPGISVGPAESNAEAIQSRPAAVGVRVRDSGSTL